MTDKRIDRRLRGFTLIELLVVIIIIGVLAALAIPKFASTKEKTYLTRMVHDLRNLATSQEAYFNDYRNVLHGVAAVHIAGFLPQRRRHNRAQPGHPERLVGHGIERWHPAPVHDFLRKRRSGRPGNGGREGGVCRNRRARERRESERARERESKGTEIGALSRPLALALALLLLLSRIHWPTSA